MLKIISQIFYKKKQELLAAVSMFILTFAVFKLYNMFFKNFFRFEFASPELESKVFPATIILTVLLGIFIISKVLWSKSVAMTTISILAYRLIMATLFTALLSGAFLILNCGNIVSPLVFSYGGISLLKLYWTEMQLFNFCIAELLRLDKAKLGIDIAKIVVESENNADTCRLLLAEAIAKADLTATALKASNSYLGWFYWMLGITQNPETHALEPSMWTYGFFSTVILSALAFMVWKQAAHIAEIKKQEAAAIANLDQPVQLNISGLNHFMRRLDQNVVVIDDKLEALQATVTGTTEENRNQSMAFVLNATRTIIQENHLRALGLINKLTNGLTEENTIISKQGRQLRALSATAKLTDQFSVETLNQVSNLVLELIDLSQGNTNVEKLKKIQECFVDMLKRHSEAQADKVSSSSSTAGIIAKLASKEIIK